MSSFRIEVIVSNRSVSSSDPANCSEMEQFDKPRAVTYYF